MAEENKDVKDVKKENLTLEELIYVATKLTKNDITEEEITKFGEKMVVRSYVPILEKMRAVMTVIFNMNNQDVEMEEIRVISMKKDLFFNVLLPLYAMVDVSNQDLLTYQTYDLLYPIFSPYILQYCEKDYKEIEEIIQQSLNIYAMKDLGSLLENIDYVSLDKAAQKNKELLQKMAEDKEAIKEIKELYESMNAHNEKEETTKIINKLAQLSAIKEINNMK